MFDMVSWAAVDRFSPEMTRKGLHDRSISEKCVSFMVVFFRCSIWHRGATAEIRMYRSVLASRKQSHHWSSRWTPNMCQLSRKRCLAQMIVVVSLSPHRPQYYLLKRKQFSEEKLSQMAWRTGLLSQRSTWKAVSAVNESDCARFICFAVDWKTIL